METSRTITGDIGFFQNSSYFSEQNFTRLQNIMYPKVVPKGTLLFQEGDRADRFFFLKEGAVKLSRYEDGVRELLIYCFGPGDLFGEVEGLDGKVYSFNAKCVDDCSIGVIAQRDLEDLLCKHNNFSIDFVKWMGYMQRFTQMKIRDLLFYGKTGALASILVRMVNTYGVYNENGIRFSVHFTNSELASMIGATRETVNRMLHQLKNQKIIDYQSTEIVVYDLDTLKKICHCEDCPAEVCRL